MVGLATVVDAIEQARTRRPHVAVAISGFGGAGKSTLTRTLVTAVSDSIRLRGDDFLDPRRSHLRSADWGGVERRRMRTEVIDPFRRGDPVSFRPYDWDRRQLGRLRTLRPASVLLVDGIGILHPELADCFDLTIWVDVDLAAAGRQGRERDRWYGHDHDRLWSEVWSPNDRDFAATFDPAASADLRFDPTGWVGQGILTRRNRGQ